MAIEIERKFLLKRLPDLSAAQARSLTQGYLRADPDASVRVRISDERAWLTIKGRARGATRHEYEYPVPLDDAREMLALRVGSLIEKRRYNLTVDGRDWEVDVFQGDNAGLMVAEIELAAEGETLSLPDWLGEEVTNDPRYLNSSLCRKPYGTWAQVGPAES